MSKVAIISGISGQDGSYLAELLLSKGYEVHGIERRVAVENINDRNSRIANILDKITLHIGDIQNYARIYEIISKVKPDEFYHLAAMSFVQTSFEDEFGTMESNATGTLTILNCLRNIKKDCKFYHAATSELFGKVQETPQNENTPFYPRSPYGISKAVGFYYTRMYREAYNMFCCNGILFNHESILKNSPIIIKGENGLIDIFPIEDIFKSEKHKYEGIKEEFKGLSVWNGEDWTKIIAGTCYRDITKKTKLIQTRQSSYEATDDHVAFDEKNIEISTKDWRINDRVFINKNPILSNKLKMDLDFAKFIGFIVGDGYISDDGKIRLTGTNKDLLLLMANLILKQYAWSYRLSTFGVGKFAGCSKLVWQLDINNDTNFGLWIRKNIYTIYSKEKRIPKFILNAGTKVKKSFVEGYYLADGRKAGHESYEIKGFTTASQTLCLGLNLLINQSYGQIVKTKCEYRKGNRYYYTQARSPKTLTGKHLIKCLNEIIDIQETSSIDGWFYDIQTESQTFCTGSNLFKIHNSPRRGFEFVTRKISRAVAEIVVGKRKELLLGNLDAKRDWGFAKDYIEAMWLMLQQDKPDDFVIASGETHSIREFLDIAFESVGLNWKDYVKQDERFVRPAEVDLLLGDASKAKKILGWEPKVKFNELVKLMVKHDLEDLEK